MCSLLMTPKIQLVLFSLFIIHIFCRFSTFPTDIQFEYAFDADEIAPHTQKQQLPLVNFIFCNRSCSTVFGAGMIPCLFDFNSIFFFLTQRWYVCGCEAFIVEFYI